jgi:hypothetical protein
MKTLLAAAWSFSFLLSFGGVAVVWAGVAVFGWYFLQANVTSARSGSGAVPWKSWRGRGPKRGIWIFAAGALVLLVAFLLKSSLPHTG